MISTTTSKQFPIQSFKTKDYSKDQTNDSSIRFLPMIKSFFNGLLTLMYTVTLYPFVRLFQWWLSVIKYFVFEIPKMSIKMACQFFVSNFTWISDRVFLPLVNLLFVNLMKIPDGDVSNYLNIDISRLTKSQRGVTKPFSGSGRNVIGKFTQKVITPVFTKVSEQISSKTISTPKSQQLVSNQQLEKEEKQPELAVDEQESQVNEKIEKLSKQVDTLNLIISKQKSKIEKFQHAQEVSSKSNLEKFEVLRKEKDNLLHEKNRLEHTTLTQLQTMQEVQVMLNNQAKKIYEFEQLKENLTNQAHHIKEENQQLKNESLKERERIKKFNSEVDRWNNQKENLENQIVLLSREIQLVNEDNLKLKEKNFALEKGRKENTQQLDAFEKIKQDFQDVSIKLTQKQDEVNQLSDFNKEKSNENELLRRQVGDLDSELRRVSLDYSKLKNLQSHQLEQQQQGQTSSSSSAAEMTEIPAKAKTQEVAAAVPIPPLQEEETKEFEKQVSEEEEFGEEEMLEEGIMEIKEMESDRIKPESSATTEKKTIPFYDSNINQDKKKKQATISEGKQQADKHLEQPLDQKHLKEPYLTPSWEEETIIESNKVPPTLSRRKSQQQLQQGQQGDQVASEDIYQVSDTYVEELNYMLDDIEKGDIENVQFQSVISNPKIDGSLSKLDPEQIDDLLDVLENNDSVYFIDFSNCGMDNSLTQKILHSLSKNISIEVIDLATNCVEPNSVVNEVIEFIQNNHTCNKLLMKDWKFSDENLSKIVQSIQLNNRTLVDLKLDSSDNCEENQMLLYQTIQKNILAKK